MDSDSEDPALRRDWTVGDLAVRLDADGWAGTRRLVRIAAIHGDEVMVHTGERFDGTSGRSRRDRDHVRLWRLPVLETLHALLERLDDSHALLEPEEPSGAWPVYDWPLDELVAAVPGEIAAKAVRARSVLPVLELPGVFLAAAAQSCVPSSNVVVFMPKRRHPAPN